MATMQLQAPLLRDPHRGWAGGVFIAIAERLSVSPALLRGGFVLGVLLSEELRGLLLLGYVLLWIAIPASQQAAASGVRWVLAGILGFSVVLLLLAVQEYSRMSLGLIAVPALIGTATAVLRQDNLAAKLGLLLAGVAISGLLFMLDYRPVVGSSQTVAISSPSQLRGEPYTAIGGHLTLDLRELSTATTGSIRVHVLSLFSDVRILLPEHAVLRTKDSSVSWSASHMVAEDGAGLYVTLHLDGPVRHFEVLQQN